MTTKGARRRAVWLRTVLQSNSGIGSWTVLAAGAVVLLLGLGFFVSAVTETPIGFLLRDPNAIAKLPFYYGALEYAGIVLMAGAGGIAVFSATLCTGRAARFLFLGGLLTLMLVCDDLYMLHENSWRLRLNELVTFATYGAFALLFAATNYRHLLRSPFLLLLTGGFFFATAIAVDAMPGLAERLPRGSEDILELVGICFWSTYFVKCSRDALLDQRSGRI